MDYTTIPYLELADGTVLFRSECGYYEHKLYCSIKDQTMSNVFELFSDPEKTKIIKYVFRSTETVYNDFTELIAIQKKEETINVTLVGGTKGGSEDDQNETE